MTDPIDDMLAPRPEFPTVAPREPGTTPDVLSIPQHPLPTIPKSPWKPSGGSVKSKCSMEEIIKAFQVFINEYQVTLLKQSCTDKKCSFKCSVVINDQDNIFKVYLYQRDNDIIIDINPKTDDRYNWYQAGRHMLKKCLKENCQAEDLP